MHPGAYDANARLKYMDEMGIWAMVMYPNVAGFGNQQFLQLGDPELMLACVEAYNDWQTDWASADSRRLLPITSIPVLGHRRRGQGGPPLRRRRATAASSSPASPRPSASRSWATATGTRCGRPRSS